MRPHEPLKVFIIEDDREIREALCGLLRSVGLQAEAFASVQEFKERWHSDVPGCFILDVRLPGRSGLDFHADLVRSNANAPVIFISGYADVPMSVRAMKAGAIEFLTKPVRHQDLIEAVQVAIDRERMRRKEQEGIETLSSSYGGLTAREREVMRLVVSGLLNKQIAEEIGLTEATVKAHRGQVMRKMGASSLVDLVRMADKLRLLGAQTETA